MRFLTRSLMALFLAALSFGALAYAGYTLISAIQTRAEAPTGGPGAGRERTFNVRVMTIAPEQVTPVLAAFGEVRTRRSLDLRAPVGGPVLEVAAGFEDGARVEEGQLLFRIDPADAEAALALAQSDMARTEAELRDATRALELAAEDVSAAQEQLDLRVRALTRRQDLAARGVATEAALEEAELAASSARQALVGRRQAEAQAEARLDQAIAARDRQRITLAEAERRLADTRVYASFTGTLTEITLTEGGLVTANEQLGRIIDPDALEVAVRVSTAQYLRLLDQVGQLRESEATVALEVAGFEITSPGRLVRASATVEQGQSGRRIYVDLDAPRGFRPGDFVTVRLPEPALDTVALVPAAAVTAAGTVLALNDDNRLDALPVSVLRRQGGDVIIEVSAALTGREIVREITPNLGAGILVRPQRQTATGEPVTEAPEMVILDADRRAKLIAQVEANARMPAEARARMLAQLSQEAVPATIVERLENGGGTGRGGPGGG
ncbi:MAG: HlyD family efflux transporter periplasmic adaptor subunit [Rhodobacteraceae bacterium]|nr:MAG: HlyD family efflux transporter periplasmic adaptor subunit [Paracoccaceae bacterium]